MRQNINTKTSFFVKFVHISRINPVWIFNLGGVIHREVRKTVSPKESESRLLKTYFKNKFYVSLCPQWQLNATESTENHRKSSFELLQTSGLSDLPLGPDYIPKKHCIHKQLGGSQPECPEIEVVYHGNYFTPSYPVDINGRRFLYHFLVSPV